MNNNNRIKVIKPDEITPSFINQIEEEFPYASDDGKQLKRKLEYITFDTDYLLRDQQVKRVLKNGGALCLILFQYLREMMAISEQGYYINLSEYDQEDFIADIAYTLRTTTEDISHMIELLRSEKMITVVTMPDGRVLITAAMQIRNFLMINTVRKDKRESAVRVKRKKENKNNTNINEEPVNNIYEQAPQEMENPFTGEMTELLELK